MAPLPRSTPEKQGVASTALITFLQEINKDIRHLHSFMFLRHGSVISEGWWNPWQTDTRHMLFSLSKSFTSTAVGIAISEGRFQLTDRLVDLFPDKLPGKVSQNLADMQVKHLLSMSTGQIEDTTPFIVFEEDPVRAFLARPVDYKPGTHFFYNSGSTFMLSHLITKTTGLKLIDYLKPRILQPLGIEKAEWESHPDGIDFGGWGLSIKTEDIALFGQLYLQKGRWNGQQLIPEAWVQQASSFQADNAPDENPDWAQGYGFQFWLCSPPGVYRGDGAFGQYCIIMPEQDAVIAITASCSGI
ncbi:MAG: serine hydrolase, partial [Chloroflexota bacterium]